jgi:beta-galactosidase
MGARSGTKDLDNNVVTDLLPGALRPLVGATVVEYGRQNIPDARPLELEIGGERVQSREWYEQLDADAGAEVWSRWTTRHQAGSAAATIHRLGKGSVLYVGTYLNGAVGKAIVPELVKLAQLAAPLPGVPQGVEIVRRQSKEKTLWFMLNQTDEPKSFKVPAGRDLVGDREIAGDLQLPVRGVAVIQCGKP